MAWTAYINLDEDKPNIGSVTAIWNEGQADEVLVDCGRFKVEAASLAEIVTIANARKTEIELKRTREANLKASVEGALNG